MILRTKRRRIRGWRYALALTIGCTISGTALAQKQAVDPRLAAVFKDWQFRQGVLKTARYVLTGTTEFKDDNLPPGSPDRPRRVILLLDFANNRYRLEESQDIVWARGKEGEEKLEYHTRISTSAYDGRALQKLRHRKVNGIKEDLSDLSIAKGELGLVSFFGSELQPIAFAHGIILTIHSPSAVYKLPLAYDPDQFQFRGQQLLRGQNCLFVQTDPVSFGGPGEKKGISEEFWINPKEKGAIHRYVYFNDSNPWTRLDIFWKNTASGWWVDHWTNTWSLSGRVRRVYRLRVEKFEANPEVSDDDFILPAEPGMKVTVSEGGPLLQVTPPFKGTLKTYIISPSGSWDEISAKGTASLDREKNSLDSRWERIIWYLGNGLAIGAVLFYLLRRQRKKTAS